MATPWKSRENYVTQVQHSFNPGDRMHYFIFFYHKHTFFRYIKSYLFLNVLSLCTQNTDVNKQVNLFITVNQFHPSFNNNVVYNAEANFCETSGKTHLHGKLQTRNIVTLQEEGRGIQFLVSSRVAASGPRAVTEAESDACLSVDPASTPVAVLHPHCFYSQA